jgi:hypothetical protein
MAAPTMLPRSSVRTGSSIVFQVMYNQFNGCGSTTLTVATGCGVPVRMLPSARLHSACSLLCTLTLSNKECTRAISPRNEQTTRGPWYGRFAEQRASGASLEHSPNA